MARKTAKPRKARGKGADTSVDLDVPEAPAPRAFGSGGLLAAALFSFAVVVTFGILWQEFSGRPAPAPTNKPTAAASAPAPATSAPMTSSEGEAPSLDQAMNNLVARLEANPDDIDGWMLLGRSFMVVGNFAQAEGAYARAAELAPGDPDILVALGEALLRNAGDLMTPAAERRFRQAAERDPSHLLARYFVALADFQLGRRDAAVSAWQRLLAESEPDAPWVEATRRHLAEAGVTPPLGPAAQPVTEPPAETTSEGAAEAPFAAMARELQDASPEERQEMIESMVEGLAARLQDEPEDFNGWAMLARSYATLGRPEEAERHLEAAIEAQPAASTLRTQLEGLKAQLFGG